MLHIYWEKKGGLSSRWENHKAVTPAPSNMTSYWLPGTHHSTVALVTVASPNTFPSTNICTKCQKQAHKYCCWRRRWPLQEASTTRIHRMIDEDQDISRRAGCNLWLKKDDFGGEEKTKQNNNWSQNTCVLMSLVIGKSWKIGGLPACVIVKNDNIFPLYMLNPPITLHRCS